MLVLKVKAFLDEGADLYLDSSSTSVDDDACLIDLGACFRMTPYRELFCKYERYDENAIIYFLDYTSFEVISINVFHSL